MPVKKWHETCSLVSVAIWVCTEKGPSRAGYGRLKIQNAYD
jgi:hypothetical protein